MDYSKRPGNEVEDASFFRVLLELKNNIMRSVNVADIGIVKKIENDVYLCSMLNDDSMTISCMSFSDNQINIGDKVLIIYLNTDYRPNLKKIKDNQKTQKYESKERHSVNYGVIVSGGSGQPIGKITIVESWISVDKKTWYRKWSDGWKEMGSIVYMNPHAEINVSLPITFDGDKYFITTSCLSMETNGAFVTIRGRQRDGFLVTNSSTSNPVDMTYYACGY